MGMAWAWCQDSEVWFSFPQISPLDMSIGLFPQERKQISLNPVPPIKKPRAQACEMAQSVSVLVGEMEDLH